MSVFSLVDFFPRFLRSRKREAALKLAANWPVLTAKLLTSIVVPKDIAAEEGSVLQAMQVESAYYFTLDGNYYGGHARSIPLSDSEAHRLVPQLAEDTPIQIRYNPQNPDETHTFATDNPGFPYVIWPM
ncbi:hypothetical protein FTO74_09265 [Granulicella sp. WH15]|uniref:DUF3592 domain-containing protein n=1 Tax=Granulicella sp. WH15 TaxID=2602070 RepID=UPI001366D1C3|nr:hypothetical protein [Granulicella sp. WH15]QHN03536.1 hypothetical protein FTO74_09265 [Granulicella sp. WH15]